VLAPPCSGEEISEIDRAIALWESILRTDPLDVVAFRLAHFANFWLGRPQDMVSSVERVMPAWSEDTPGYASILACHCFAHEEAGHYRAAEPSGRRAIELDPGNLWAAHAVAHVLEMQGRRSEGIEWLTTLAPNWEGSHNLQHHLWWHLALFKLEYGDYAGVLELYDTRFRNLAAPLTVAAPDVYIDVQNAASTLRYSAYIPPPAAATVLPSRALAAGDEPAATTVPAPSFPTGIAWPTAVRCAGSLPPTRDGTCDASPPILSR